MRSGAVDAFAGNDEGMAGLIDSRDHPLEITVADQIFPFRDYNPAFFKEFCLHIKGDAQVDRATLTA
ncbi:hypothetical protein D3C73_1631940 [compost metagenome]